MLAVLGRYGTNFSFTPIGNQEPAVAFTGLNDVQVLVNGIPAPIFRLDSAVIYFQVPMAARSSGTADFGNLIFKLVPVGSRNELGRSFFAAAMIQSLA